MPALSQVNDEAEYDLLDSIFADLDDAALDNLSRPAAAAAAAGPVRLKTNTLSAARKPLSTLPGNKDVRLSQEGKPHSRQALSPRKPHGVDRNTGKSTRTEIGAFQGSAVLKSPSTRRSIQNVRANTSTRPFTKTVMGSTSSSIQVAKHNQQARSHGVPQSKSRATAVVAKGAADADLLAGIEWSDDELDIDVPNAPSERVDKGKAVERADAKSAALALERSQPGYTPHSKRYLRCRVLSVTEKVVRDFRREKTLIVEVEQTKECRRVLLLDEWATTNVGEGDTVNIIGQFQLARPSSSAVASTSQQGLHEDLLTCILSYSSSNLIIVHPDTLISATRASDAHQCARKAVVQEKVKTSGESTAALVYGNLLHEVFQGCLLAVAESEVPGTSLDQRIADAFALARREQEIDRLLKIPKNIESLFTISIELDEARTQLRERSIAYAEFAHEYMGQYPHADAYLSDPRRRDADLSSATRLSISAVHDIEEDVWSPRLGLKGKIDASVQACLVGPPNPAWPLGQEERAVIPFEIKTGKSFSIMQHRAQTILYTQMMADRYDRTIDSGLLYYTQNNSLTKVEPVRNELRGLLIARNEIARFLTPPPGEDLGGQNESGLQDASIVPEGPLSPITGSKRVEGLLETEEDALWADIEDVNASVAANWPDSVADRGPVLPPAVDDAKICKKCYAADACMIYRRALDGTRFIGPDDEPLQQTYDDRTGHLSDTHAEFFRTWERLISLEERELTRTKKEIWNMSADQREWLGRCLANMVLDQTFAPESYRVKTTSNHRYVYRLVRASTVPDRLSTQLVNHTQLSQSSGGSPHLGPLNGGQMSAGDPVVVSLEPSVLALARGYILDINNNYIELGLDHSLAVLPGGSAAVTRRAGDQFVFRVDKDELQAGLGRLRENLAQLFYAHGDEKRRRLVVELERPRFNDPGYRQLEPQEVRASNLNADQQLAIDTVLRTQDYALILGMPGTGKTTTIAATIVALAARGKSVLLTSYTHSAVDNILLKIKDSDISILRLGQLNRVMPSLAHLTLAIQDPATSISQLEQRLFSPQVVATTALGIDHPIFSRRKFDYCIVDEASQITLPACLGPLRFAERFILVGDHNQLPPLVKNVQARKGGYDMSLFRRLSEGQPTAVVNLTHQYRMNEDIMSISNKLVYGNSLICGTPALATQLMTLEKGLPAAALQEVQPEWTQHLADPRRTVVFADTDALPAREERFGRLVQNETEARLLVKTAEALLQQGAREDQIGVIALYRQQIQLLEGFLARHKDVEILTADRSQGRDKDCILMSLTRSNANKQVGDLLKDWRRINVCFTRARFKLVIFGSRSTLAEIPHMADFFDLADSKGWTYGLPSDALHSSSSSVAVLPTEFTLSGAADIARLTPDSPKLRTRPASSSAQAANQAPSTAVAPEESLLDRRAVLGNVTSFQQAAASPKRVRTHPFPPSPSSSNERKRLKSIYKDRPILRDIVNSQ